MINFVYVKINFNTNFQNIVFFLILKYNIIGFFNFQFLVTHVITAITCVTRVFTLFPIYLG